MEQFYRDLSQKGLVYLLFSAFALLTFVGCSSTPARSDTSTQASEPAANAIPAPVADQSLVLYLGDIDADEPTKKVKRLQPVAGYLADHLSDLGVKEVRVTIAHDIEEMAEFMREGQVDIYFDSAFPTLAVQEKSDSQVILRRWKGGDPEYWSVYLAHRDSGITKVEDLVGKIVAVEEPHSTSGFVLPIGTLVEQGYVAREADGPAAEVAPNEVGYFFARDEQNIIELLLQGRVAGAGFSNQDYDELPPEIKQELNVFGSTLAVPRQLVSVRPGLDPDIERRVIQVLSDMDQSERGREVLEGFKKTKKFDLLPEESGQALLQLKGLMDLVATAD